MSSKVLSPDEVSEQAARRANWWPPAPRSLNYSRGNGFLPGLLGLLCLVGGAGIFLGGLGLVDAGLPPRGGSGFILFLGSAAFGLGVWLFLGRAGSVLDGDGRHLHQWWGLIRWPWKDRTVRIDRCVAVRARPRLANDGSKVPSEVWFVSIVDAGDTEYDVHRLASRADAERVARVVAERAALPFEVRTDLPGKKMWWN